MNGFKARGSTDAARAACRRPILRGTRQRGLTLIETALALGILSIVIASLSLMMAGNMELARGKAAADKITEVYEASKGYMKANHAALLSQTAGGTVVIPSGRPNAASPVPSGPGGLPSLQGGGYLPAAYVDSNGYGQRHSLVVRRLGANGLQAIVTTHGGRQIPDSQLGRIANLVGAAGGYTPQVQVNPADANQVIGSYGGWRTPVADWGPPGTRPAPGSVQASLAFEDGNLLTDYLYRNDIGIPEANRMNTHIDMNLNDLNNADNVRSINVWATEDVTADRDVSAGRDTVAGQDARAGRDMLAHRHVNAATGNVTADVGDVNAGRDVRAGRDLAVVRDAQVGRNLDVTQLVTAGDVRAQRLSLDSVVYNISPGGNNRGLAATQGIRLGDLLPRQVPQYSYYVTENTGDVVPKPNCAGDRSRARIMVLPQRNTMLGTGRCPTDGVNGTCEDHFSFSQHVPYGGGTVSFSHRHRHQVEVPLVQNIYAEDSPTTWRVRYAGTPPVPGEQPRQAVALTFCFYE